MEPSPLAARRTTEELARDRDLGFGSVVTRESRNRLLNRDGTFNVVRSGLDFVEALAPHYLLRISWPTFICLVVGVYVGLNLLFAAAFVACGANALLGPGAEMLGGRLARAFFFSVQTFGTIGYGQIGPNGFAANILVTIEALVALMYQAIATGLLFARFARPRPAIVFSGKAVVAPYGERTAFEFRIANQRSSEIIELEAQVLYSALEFNDRGSVTRQYHLLPLERNKVVFLPLAWTIVHPIDASSPLFGKSVDDLRLVHGEILVLLSGIDETFEQTVHARSSYLPDEIVWNARFASIFLPPAPERPVAIDIGKISEIEPVFSR